MALTAFSKVIYPFTISKSENHNLHRNGHSEFQRDNQILLFILNHL